MKYFVSMMVVAMLLIFGSLSINKMLISSNNAIANGLHQNIENVDDVNNVTSFNSNSDYGLSIIPNTEKVVNASVNGFLELVKGVVIIVVLAAAMIIGFMIYNDIQQDKARKILFRNYREAEKERRKMYL
jgi:hypothetical protein